MKSSDDRAARGSGGASVGDAEKAAGKTAAEIRAAAVPRGLFPRCFRAGLTRHGGAAGASSKESFSVPAFITAGRCGMRCPSTTKHTSSLCAARSADFFAFTIRFLPRMTAG